MLETEGEFKARNGHTSVLLRDNYMIVFGGISDVTKELDDLCCLDIDNQLWS